jgi:hypothetical protein
VQGDRRGLADPGGASRDQDRPGRCARRHRLSPPAPSPEP